MGLGRSYKKNHIFRSKQGNGGVRRLARTNGVVRVNADRCRHLLHRIADSYGTQIFTDVSFRFRMRSDRLDAETLSLLADAPSGLFSVTFVQPPSVLGLTNDDGAVEAVCQVATCGNVQVALELIADASPDRWWADFNAAYTAEPHRIRIRVFPAHLPDGEAASILRAVRAVQYLYNRGWFRDTAAYLIRTCRIEPAAFYRAVGQKLPLGRLSPDTVRKVLWDSYADNPCVEAECLRDMLLCDHLRSFPEQPLPKLLDIDSQVRLHLEKLADSDRRFCRVDGIARGAGLLSDGTLAYADRCRANLVTGKYDLCFFSPRCLERPYRYVLFDLDGTITDPRQGIVNSVRYALQYQQIEEPDDGKLLRFIGPPLKDSFRMFYGMNEQQAETALQTYRQFYSKTGIFQCRIYDGMSMLLRQLRRSSYRVMLATSKPELYARQLLRHYGITDCFTTIAGADMQEKRANKAAVIRYALEREGVTETDEAVMVGDRCFDVEGGRACGLSTIGVTYGYGTEAELMEFGADRIVHSVEELRKLLL